MFILSEVFICLLDVVEQPVQIRITGPEFNCSGVPARNVLPHRQAKEAAEDVGNPFPVRQAPPPFLLVP